ncbi:hypothetical protein ASZ90_003591 [hydrocarbon metagenome]|uniref:Uncharacterized protein n=1 Tax=hydrocarbon metagenome TaxID=938273 RepID=A0A0W8G097_9ZZZZ
MHSKWFTNSLVLLFLFSGDYEKHFKVYNSFTLRNNFNSFTGS